MKVTVEYFDQESFLLEEVIKQARNNYGKNAKVTIEPDSTQPIDYLYFALQRLITGDHIQILYDSGPTYQQDLKKLRSEILYKVGEVLDEVIMDTEARLH